MEKTKEKTKDESAETKTNNSLVNSVYINPLTDFGFKKLFYNKELLIPFLNDIVGTDIKDIEYKPTENFGWFAQERTAVFDLLCTTKNEEYFIVEMQLGHQKYFIERVLFYSSHIIRKQAPRKKNWDFNLKAVYIVSILSFNVFRDKASKGRVIERAYLCRESTREHIMDKLQMIFIQLPKFKKALSELLSNMDKWLFLLKNTDNLKSCPSELKGNPFKLFLEIAELKQLTPEDMKSYEVSLEKSYQMRNIADFARMEGMKEGELKGIKKGLREGKIEGLLEGKKEGLLEGKKQLAIKLMMRNMPLEDIISLTELSQEQVNALLSQLPKD